MLNQGYLDRVFAVAKAEALPKFYPNDLNIDRKELETHGHKCDHWIWALRTHGTNLIPCYVGASDAPLTVFEDIQKFYVLDTHQETIEETDKETALRLINGSLCSRHNLKSSWHKIVHRGIEMGLWGGFIAPQFEQLKDPIDALVYFRSIGNKPMRDHCFKLVNSNIKYI